MQVELQVKGMTCSNCALTVEKYLKNEGMEGVMVDFSTDEVIFDTVDEKKLPKVIKGIDKLGYKVVTTPPLEGEKEGMSRVEKYFYASLPFTALLILHMFVPWHLLHNPWVQLSLATPVFAIGLWHFGRSAWHSLKGGIPNMDVLIILGAIAAFGYSLFGTLTAAGPDFLFYETAASIITLVLLGNVIEHRAVAKTTSAVKSLMQLQKGKALRVIESPEGEVMERVPLEAIQKGFLLQVNQGDRMPVDGRVIWGEGTVDESMLTGESEAVFKQKDNSVIGGTLLQSGNLRMQATAVGKQTVLSQIIDMVKRAQADKPAIQQLADRISAVFVPVVVGIALLTFGLSYFVFGLSLQASIIHSVAVLVISCPCAMGLATPTAVVVGIGRASKKGILIKGGRTLEAFSQLKYIVFDKTGTLTTGNFEVEAINCQAKELEKIKAVVAGLEARSSHPIAASLQKEIVSDRKLEWEEIKEVEGLGMEGTDKEGNTYRLGSYRWAETLTSDDAHPLYLIKNDELWATIDLRDEIREGAKTALDALKERGLIPVMLSGDRRAKCETIAQQLGIDQVYAEKLPSEKLEVIEQLNESGGAAMVGDGINDAPALAKAQVGISLSQATQAAIQSADIVLLHGRLSGLKDLLAIGKHTVMTIRQNLFWAFAYNIVAIPMAAFGLLSPILGAAAMAFSDVVVVGNSLRLRSKRIS